MPTATPEAVERFDPGSWWKENNCFDLGVYGIIFDAQGNPIEGITVEVIGTEDTYTATSDDDGNYDVHLGSLLDHPDGAKWLMQLRENGQIVSKPPIEWNTSRDCEDEDQIQILRMEWKRKS